MTYNLKQFNDKKFARFDCSANSMRRWFGRGGKVRSSFYSYRYCSLMLLFEITRG